MKKVCLIALAALLPATTMAVEEDSVYAWGAWAEGIQPAAGPTARVNPQPAQKPQVNFRPNENSALARGIVRVEVPAVAAATPPPTINTSSFVNVSNVNTSQPVQTAPPSLSSPPPAPPVP